MRIVKITFEEGFRPTPQQIVDIHGAFLDQTEKLSLHDKSDKNAEKAGTVYPWYTYTVWFDRLPVDVPYRLERTVYVGPIDDLDTNTGARVPAFNKKVQVIVPSLGLLLLDEVMLANDCCTDELNRLMREQCWRIVAVCPQPDQRRPDYILGRARVLDEATL